MKVKMVSISASPDKVLDQGKVYNLPTEEALEFCTGGFAVEVPSNTPALRVPLTPDPEDVPGDVDEDEDDK